MAVAVGPGDLDEAVDFGVGQVFTRPHLGIACPFGRPAGRLDCPNKVAGATSAGCDFAIGFRGSSLVALGTVDKARKVNKYRAEL
jgi:hypothetical protein